MELLSTALPGVVLLQPKVFGDARGFFMETYSETTLAEMGITSRFVQDNHSLSGRGTLRGLHFQLKHPQAKLCRVVRGRVLDIAVDVRVGSPHFGRWISAELSEENKTQIYVPRGFAHGFVVLSESAEFLYKCDDTYHPEDEGGVAWDDSQLNINWMLQENGITSPLLSKKDTKNRRLNDIPHNELPQYRGVKS